MLEEHARHGGLAERIALKIAECLDAKARIIAFHVSDFIAGDLVGSQKELRALIKIAAASVARRVARRSRGIRTACDIR